MSEDHFVCACFYKNPADDAINGAVYEGLGSPFSVSYYSLFLTLKIPMVFWISSGDVLDMHVTLPNDLLTSF